MPDWQTSIASLLVLWALAYSLRTLLPARWLRALVTTWSRCRGMAPGDSPQSPPASACAACHGCAGAARPLRAARRVDAATAAAIALPWPRPISPPKPR